MKLQILNYNMRKVVSLDIGGTNCRAAIVNESHNIERTIIKNTSVGSVDIFLKQVKDIISELDIKNEGIESITLGVPGRVRWDGFIYALPNIHIENISLAEYLHGAFKVPVYVKNDAEIAGYAEACIGAGKDFKSVFFVTISTGVGGALVVDKKLTASSYEIGHTLFEYQGEQYEFEHLASGTGIVRLAKLNGLEINRAPDLFALLENKNQRAIKVYNDWLNLLTQFFSFIQDTFEPNIIVVTGGVMKSSSVFWKELCKMNPKSNLAKCYFDQDAGLMGAACFGLNMPLIGKK